MGQRTQDRPAEQLLQLEHIAGPVMGQQRSAGFRNRVQGNSTCSCPTTSDAFDDAPLLPGDVPAYLAGDAYSEAASKFTAASANSVIISSATYNSFTAARSCLLSSLSFSALENAATVPKPVMP